MSGVVAVLAASGQPGLSQAIAQRLMTGIAHRGPHGRDLISESEISLGHAFLDSTGDPAGPWRNRSDGPVLTGDLCLSNADALCEGGRPFTDADAILTAYDRWGTDLLEHLEGSFAFVLWDPARKRLFAARDRFGVKPLYLRELPGVLMLCSEPLPLATAHGQYPVPNEHWIADFLAGYDTSCTMTADAGIDRLAPGHCLISEAGRTDIRQWWTLSPSDHKSGGQRSFAELLDHACQDGLRGGKTAAMLSGGLDSSSICVLAQRHSASPLATLSLRYPSAPDLDEGRFITAVLKAGSFDPHDVEGDPEAVLADLEAVMAEQQNPFPGLGLGTVRRLYTAAAALGKTAILDGHGGDEVVSQGFELLTSLARSGKPLRLATVSRALGHHLGTDWWPIALTPLAEVGPRPWGGAARRALRWIGQSPVRPPWRGLVHPDLAQRSDLVARVQQAEAAKRAAPSAGEAAQAAASHMALAANPGTSAAFEVLDRAAARAGLEPRYPFYDHRLVEWCVSQPAEAKLTQGRPRALLRDGMRGLLPDLVRLRKDKVNFMPNILRGLAADPSGQIAAFASAPPDRLSPYINLDALREAARSVLSADPTADPNTVFWVWRALWLDLWLTFRERNQGQTVGDHVGGVLRPHRRAHALQAGQIDTASVRFEGVAP